MKEPKYGYNLAVVSTFIILIFTPFAVLPDWAEYNISEKIMLIYLYLVSFLFFMDFLISKFKSLKTKYKKGNK